VRVLIAAIGKMKQGPERELVARYLTRAAQSGKPLGLTGFEVLETPESRAGALPLRKGDEGRALQGLCPAGAVIVSLDEKGKELTSPALAAEIATWRDDGKPALAFLIGGADGLDLRLVRSADLSLSFSPLTWPHQLVRIMLAEQLYRATTILSGHPYHRD
jgi:23S rRNA (pseudouridine1915-N3)-methyltransferase